MKIIFYESTLRQEGDSRFEFQKKLILDGITLVKSELDLKNLASSIDVLFYHKSDINDIRSYNRQTKSEDWLLNIQGSIKIAWGGRDTVKKPLELGSEKIEYLKYSELENKLPDFGAFFSTQKSIEEIYNFLFNINDEVDELLQPFIYISPFANAKGNHTYIDKEGDKKEINVGDAYEAIQAYEKKNSL